MGILESIGDALRRPKFSEGWLEEEEERLQRIKEALPNIAADVSQRQIRRLNSEARLRIGQVARGIALAPQRIESIGDEPDAECFAEAADAIVVSTRVGAVLRQTLEESRRGGKPKRKDRSEGRWFKRKRGA